MKIGIKQILSWIGSLLIVAVIVVADVLCARYSDMITGFLCGTGNNFDNATEALQQSDALVQQIEEEGITLLKNNGALPLAEDERNINVFGYGSTENGFLMRGLGSGSSTINSEKAVSLVEFNGSRDQGALNMEGFTVNDEIFNIFKNNSGSANSLRPKVVAAGNVYNLNEPDASMFTADMLQRAKTFSDVALLVISRCAGENAGEIPASYLDITAKEQAILDLMTATFDKVIVVLNTSNTMHTGFLNDAGVDAAISVGLTGQTGALAIPRILKGYKEVEELDEDGEKTGRTKTVAVTPSGKTSDTMTYNNNYDPTYSNRATGGSYTLGNVDYSNIQYREGIYYGYKWYETADAVGYFNDVNNDYGSGYKGVVQYPFGYGLSYTNFEWSLDSVSLPSGSKLTKNAENGRDSAEITIKVKVENVGDDAQRDVEGKDVVQLYCRPVYTGRIEKAEINLVDFAKTLSLKKDQSQVVELSFSAYDLASYDVTANNGRGAYVLEAGAYQLLLRTDAHTDKQMENGIITYTVDSDIIFDKDPVSGRTVENRFTGSSAYASTPVDGSTVGASQDYMKRSDFAGTFPRNQVHPTNQNAMRTAATYVYNQNLSTAGIEYGSNATSHLIATREDGTAASASELRGGNSNVKLVYNMDLLTTLWNYDAPEWNELLNQMSKAEIQDLVENGGFKRKAVESVGKPYTSDYDGPAGFNTNTIDGNQAKDTSKWTAFTSECLMGQAWNKDLMFSLGRSMAAEGAATQIYGWYAPGVNLHRSAYTARNYEYFSEDAVLSGKLAAKIVYGAKTNGMICYIKHFVCSEEGPNPRNVNTWLTEQNLRENYLRAFEIAIKEGEGNAIMTAFNNVGANWCGSNGALVTEVLRGEWDFEGVVITDWCDGGNSGQYGSGRQGVRAGNDLWLNPGSMWGDRFSTNDDTDMAHARLAAKNILYAQVDAVMTQDSVKDIDFNDIKAEIGITFQDQVFRWWIIVLVAINVIGVAGIVLLVLFCTLFPLSRAHDAQMAAAVAAANASASEGASVSANDTDVQAKDDEGDEDED